jgi:type II secretory pathway pseudopilin PulG
MIREEARTNDLTRFEKFKRWAKENIAGVSAVAISIAGIITTVVIAGRKAVKQATKVALATILNIMAQALTWGAKALEFLSKNLWLVVMAITYLLYSEYRARCNK